MTWMSAISLEKLNQEHKAVAKIGGKQIALFAIGDEVHACNNRCPHEGYSLREGTVDGACVLTCNWHGWKFDLRNGENLYQGDRLRIYPTKVVEGQVWVEVSDPPAAERQACALENLRGAFDDHEYDRMARELARLARAGADPVAAVTAAIEWSHDRFRFGMTHAYAAAAGWLQLHDESNDPLKRLSCLLEAIGHMAWDCLREPRYPFADARAAYDEAMFLAALERQDEDAAVAQLRGALATGKHFADLERVLSAAALSHYADFGHSLIYVTQAGRLIARLGARVEAPVLLALVRSLINAFREELIPEFRGYGRLLRDWPARKPNGAAPLVPGQFLDQSINETLKITVEAAAGHADLELHGALLGAAALNLLRYDMPMQDRTDNTVAENVGWLDFTHGITFANAVRLQCRKFPELWPQGLMQMACFAGRNSGYVDRKIEPRDWRIGAPDDFHAECLQKIFDHAEPEYIRSCHLVKTFLAAREEIESGLPDGVADAVMAAVIRYFRSPSKRKHVSRTAQQAINFVALED
jgi:nitrite reductase/ring-hydroxylating ferredoxin subunit